MCVARWPQLKLMSKELRDDNLECSLEASSCLAEWPVSRKLKGAKRHMPLNLHQFMSGPYLAWTCKFSALVLPIISDLFLIVSKKEINSASLQNFHDSFDLGCCRVQLILWKGLGIPGWKVWWKKCIVIVLGEESYYWVSLCHWDLLDLFVLTCLWLLSFLIQEIKPQVYAEMLHSVSLRLKQCISQKEELLADLSVVPRGEWCSLLTCFSVVSAAWLCRVDL